jgi:hypothetical protein
MQRENWQSNNLFPQSVLLKMFHNNKLRVQEYNEEYLTRF